MSQRIAIEKIYIAALVCRLIIHTCRGWHEANNAITCIRHQEIDGIHRIQLIAFFLDIFLAHSPQAYR
jgi:hypothetical protein